MVSVGSFAASMTNGSTPSRKKPDYWEGGSIPWVKTGEVNNNLLFKTNEHITELALAETPVHLLPKNAVVMALYGSGTAGRLAILQEKATTNQACTAMICRTPSQAFYLFLTLQGMYREIDSKTRGSVQQNLSKDIVASLMIPAVTEDLLNEIRLCDIYDQVRANEYESLQLASLRNALLPKLMSGEIDVSKIDPTQLNSHLAEKSIDDILRCVYQPHLPFNFSAYLTGRKFLVCCREGVLSCEQLLPVFLFMHIGACLF